MRWSLVLVFAVCELGCSHNNQAAPDAGDASVVVQPPGLFQDCTPYATDVQCQAGLRCGLVLVGDPPYQGAETECVPAQGATLAADQPCAFDQTAAMDLDMGGIDRHYDRCEPGLGCVTTARQGPVCRALCNLSGSCYGTLCDMGVAGPCTGGALCVLPATSSTVGYCAVPDGCDALAQSGCGAGAAGQPLSCYVLSDGTHGGAYCLAEQPLGSMIGGIGSACLQQVNCQGGSGCFYTGNLGAQDSCRPYCPLPTDGGLPEGGVWCGNDLGLCNSVAGYSGVGSCY